MPETQITLYNTATRRKERLEPVVPGRVSMYVCGPTVYDRAHLGNARPAVVFDTLFRLLRHVYGADNVTYVRNITDVDDKIIARAAESGTGIDELTRRTEEWYHQDMGALGVLPPSHEPHATAYISQMMAMIETLIARGHAYEAQGHVLFRVESYAGYGRLSGRSVDDMIAGARVEVAPYKENPMDFVLWKPAAPDQPGWDSPWGRGRPGWHIECSAMADALLGESFDIHGGGGDLMFPHHENEIAQSRCAHPEGGFARIWMHNEMLQVEGKKMSKSLGNFFTVRDLLDQGVPGEVIRFVMLQTHYRKPMDWTAEKAREAGKRLDRMAQAVRSADRSGARPSGRFSDLPEGMRHALGNDLNTHGAIVSFEGQCERVVGLETGEVGPHATNPGNREEPLRQEAVSLLTGADVLGLYEPLLARVRMARTPGSGVDRETADRIEALLTRREAARKARDFARADALRDAIAAAGVEVKDTPQGTEWKLGPDFDPAKLEALE